MSSIPCSGRSWSRSIGPIASVTLVLLAGCVSSAPGKDTGTGGSGGTTSSSSTLPSSTTTSSSSATASSGAVTTNSSSSSSGAGGAASGCSGLPLCDGFESDTAGSPPGASLWSLSAALGCSTVPAGAITVDSTVAHSGTNSVKVEGQPNSCAIWFGNSSAFANLGTSFFVRFYVRFGAAPGQGHGNFTAMRDSSISTTPEDQADTSLGIIQEDLIWNRRSDDASLPDQDPVGLAATQAPPAANTWSCFEYGIDETTGAIQMWVDSKEITGMEENGTAVQGISQQWLSKPWHPTFADVRFGFVSFGYPAMNVWYDDIAVGKQRIGCM